MFADCCRPYGWLDRYDPDYICNHSDDSGRYDYKSQPDICRWNCLKLAEALQGALPLSKSKQELEVFDQEFDRCSSPCIIVVLMSCLSFCVPMPNRYKLYTAVMQACQFGEM